VTSRDRKGSPGVHLYIHFNHPSHLQEVLLHRVPSSHNLSMNNGTFIVGRGGCDPGVQLSAEPKGQTGNRLPYGRGMRLACVGRVRDTPTRGTPMRDMPMRDTSIECTPMRSTPMRGTLTRYTPMRHTPVRCTPLRLHLRPPALKVCLPVGCHNDGGFVNCTLDIARAPSVRKSKLTPTQAKRRRTSRKSPVVAIPRAHKKRPKPKARPTAKPYGFRQGSKLWQ
jgi:hypothetical protein